ncbi:MAG: hypothetical protein HOK65_02535 [Crocinitomicaceae bacterium]|nr:hypothetical protein [Crocinitomicaceae bacterium]
MKSILLLASILTGIISYSQQTPSFVDSLNHWFITGQYSADILAITPNEKAQQYEKTIQDSIKNNLDWFKEFSKTIKKGSDLPYHKNLGLSETEYQEFLVLRKKKHFGLKGNAKVRIMNNDTCIGFESVGFLIGLNFITLHKSDRIAIVEPPRKPMVKLHRFTELKSKSLSNEFNSDYTGFKWNQEITEPNISQKIFYEFVVLHLYATDHIFIQITVKSRDNGQYVTTNIVPLSFKRTGQLSLQEKEIQRLEPTKK